jgi:selenocysteine lyase/cysteine desulfurase
MFTLLQVVTELISGLQSIPGITLYGIADPSRFDRRAPTVAFTPQGTTPRQVAERLGQAGIFVLILNMT